MHRVNRLLRLLRLPVLCIGIFHASLSVAEEEPDLERLAREHKVYVEPTYMTAIKPQKVGDAEILSTMLPYRERRPRWGITAALGYNSYEPSKYDPNFSNANYKRVYKQPTLPMLELTIAVKRNFSLGSLGGEFGVGHFENAHSDPNLVNSTLQITPFRLGAVFTLDNLARSPIVVPYFAGGIYSILYKESMLGSSQANSTVNGTTQMAPYASAGLEMNLEWIDRPAARVSYVDSGIQASYLYAEVRDFFVSGNAKDHDFSDDFTYGVGFRIEF